ncbi:Uncharacterized protein Adt_02736 [Abeliophyllum distichum]|uniref:Uncharacterized protein n=1 Tax=Abeliophyllum distichum TaxID=126358 RepID=A0ABD1VYX6_9LAMI
MHIKRPVAYKEKVHSTDEEHVEQTKQAVDIEESSITPQVKAAASIKPYEPPIPYPQRLNPKKKKQDQQCVEFLDHLRKLHINIPFVEALTQMPNYAKRLGIGEAKPAKFNLQLADRSVKKPFRIVEDVVMRMGKLLFSIDFVVLDMPDDTETPIILGRPFLAASDALINVETLKKFKNNFFKKFWDPKPTIKVKDKGKQAVQMQEVHIGEHTAETEEVILEPQAGAVKWKMRDKP